MDIKQNKRKSIIQGRMARKEFAIITFVPYLLGVLFAIITESTGVNEVYYLVAPILVLWFLFGYFASIRRLHDLNKSAWWLLLIALAFVLITIKESLELLGVDTTVFDMSIVGVLFNFGAIGGFVLLLALVFTKGSKEENKYGLPVTGRGFSWRGTLLNLYSESEKLDFSYIGLSALIFLSTIGFIWVSIFDGGQYIAELNQPKEINEFLGIELGEQRVNVTLLKGLPDDELDRDTYTRLIYKDFVGLIESAIDIDDTDRVERICSKEFMYKVYGLGKDSSLDEVKSVLGEPPEVSISADGTSMITTYPKQNVAFIFVRGQVSTTCVTSEERIAFLDEY